MLLALDIGNTNIVIGVYHQAQWLHHWRVETVASRMPDEYAIIFRQLFASAQIQYSDFSQIIVSSVVPQLTHGIVSQLNQYADVNPQVLSTDKLKNFAVATEPAQATGTDLLANGIAAYHRYRRDCIVVDFGTATTIMATRSPGVFQGGAICAGLHTTIKALVSETAQLPFVALQAPPSIIGNNTVHAMQSGLIWGHLSMVEGLVARMKSALANDAVVVATGGLATLLAAHTDCFDAVDPWLTLDGLRLAISEYMHVGSTDE